MSHSKNLERKQKAGTKHPPKKTIREASNYTYNHHNFKCSDSSIKTQSNSQGNLSPLEPSYPIIADPEYFSLAEAQENDLK